MEKKYLRYRICCILLALLLAALASYGMYRAGLPPLALAPLALVVYVLLYYLIMYPWVRSFTKKMNSLEMILTKDKDPDRFLREANAYLGETRSSKLFSVFNMDFVLAYEMKSDFDTALSYLDRVPVNKLPPYLHAAYWAERAYLCCFLGRLSEAAEIMDSKWTFLQAHLRQDSGLQLKRQLEVIRAHLQGDQEEAHVLLEFLERRPDGQRPDESDLLRLHRLLDGDDKEE